MTDYTQVPGGMAIYHDKDLTEFPSHQYNVLHPTTYVLEKDGPYQVVVTGVYINPDPHEEDVYKPTLAKEGHVALHKRALVKLMHAAGIQTVPEHTGRQDDGGNPNYCTFKVTGKYRTPTGGWETITANKSIDLHNEERLLRTRAQKGRKGEEWVQKELARISVDMPRLAEAKALNAMIRLALNVKQSYHQSELSKPFIIPKIEYVPHRANGQAFGVINKQIAELRAQLRETEDEAEIAKLEARIDSLRLALDEMAGQNQYERAKKGSASLYVEQDFEGFGELPPPKEPEIHEGEFESAPQEQVIGGGRPHWTEDTEKVDKVLASFIEKLGEHIVREILGLHTRKDEPDIYKAVMDWEGSGQEAFDQLKKYGEHWYADPQQRAAFLTQLVAYDVSLSDALASFKIGSMWEYSGSHEDALNGVEALA